LNNCRVIYEKLERQKVYQYIAQFQVSSIKNRSNQKTFQIEFLPKLKTQSLFLESY